ncbi:hypothetical protein [Amycolatopsis sp. cmx-11-12]|uniref:hypothetical protein n=1 Tax=Amycolatopsis sp. cmx-11-12 TaxID=2785795 RepID=UPI003916DA08
MPSKTIYTRCLPGGPWQRLLPGVVLLHDQNPTSSEMVTAALLYAGANALLSGTEACRLHGLRPSALPDAQGLHLLIPHDRKVRSVGFVTTERTVRLPSPSNRNGVPLAPLVRATTDTVRRLADPLVSEELLIEAIQQGKCHPKALLWELDHGTQRGTAVPRRLLTDWVDIRSMAEARAKLLSRGLAAPPSHWNAELFDCSGKYLGRPDAWWDAVGLAWEIDSFDFHFRRSGYRRTVDRNTRYTTAGIVVVQTLPSQLLNDPAAVIADLETAWRVAASRPRPDVRFTEAA